MTGAGPTSAKPLVVCVDAARTYGSGPNAVVAVHGANCVVPAGARIAVVGPSGSGKSTLLHLMAALDRPTAGTVGHPGLTVDPAGTADILQARDIGVVFQGPSLLPPLTALENVALPLLIDGLTADEAADRASAALAELELGALAAKLPDEMSAGQAQRVAVARMLAHAAAADPGRRADRPTRPRDRPARAGGAAVSRRLARRGRPDHHP